MELILKAVLAEKNEARKKADEKESAVEQDAESLVEELKSMQLSDVEVVSCKCTRKCKTKLCCCFKKNVPCTKTCHPHNNSCKNN